MNASIKKITSVFVLALMVLSSISVVMGIPAPAGTDVNKENIEQGHDVAGQHDSPVDLPVEGSDHVKKRGDTHPELDSSPLRRESNPRVSREDFSHQNFIDERAGSVDAPALNQQVSLPETMSLSNRDVEMLYYERDLTPSPSIVSDVLIKNLNTGVNYTDFQSAIDAASDGDSLNIEGKIYSDMSILGKNISFVDSHFSLYGDLLVDNARLTIDPSWVNMSGNWYIDAGTVNVTDNTIVQFNNSFDGEYGVYRSIPQAL